MAIDILDSFNLRTAKPIDDAYVVKNISERNSIPLNRRYEGMLVYVIGNSLYMLSTPINDNSSWKRVFNTGEPVVLGENPMIKDDALVIVADSKGNTAEIYKNGDMILSGSLKLFSNTDNEIDVKEYIDRISENGIHYKGAIDVDKSSKAYTPKAVVGDLYVITSSDTSGDVVGTINGVSVEVGDQLICYKDTEAATSSNQSEINKNWNYIQTNVSVMQGSTSSTDGSSGLVPKPTKRDVGKFLSSKGSWLQLSISDIRDLSRIVDLLKDTICITIDSSIFSETTKEIINPFNGYDGFTLYDSKLIIDKKFDDNIELSISYTQNNNETNLFNSVPLKTKDTIISHNSVVDLISSSNSKLNFKVNSIPTTGSAKLLIRMSNMKNITF